VQYKEGLEAHDQVRRAHREDITYGADEISFVENPSTNPGHLFEADSCNLTGGAFRFSFGAMVFDGEDMRKEYSQAIQGGPHIKQVRATLGRCHNDSWMTVTQTRELITVEDNLHCIFPWLPMILQGLEGNV
jgi:hypothetical protein